LQRIENTTATINLADGSATISTMQHYHKEQEMTDPVVADYENTVVNSTSLDNLPLS
jgi:hypothetical protein